MYVLFYSKYSNKCLEIMGNMDEASRARIKMISVDDPAVREYVKEFVTEVPFMVIKEGAKRYTCDYNILKETFKGDDKKLRFSNTEAPAVANKKLDMSHVREEMQRRDREIKETTNTRQLGQQPPVMQPSSAASSSSVLSQYASIDSNASAGAANPPVAAAPVNSQDVNNFFNYEVVSGAH
jgi:hypothetical protein